MTLDEYNTAVQKLMADQQALAQTTAKLAMSGQANPGSPEFSGILTKQWALIQAMAKLNTELMMGVMSPKK
ncbi:hypothetical protein [Caenimonas koreensis]|uniref:Uncharacterized protein n=1 Tax=Caenimonas koreensis DSM 17982 TaxID=1121255 RepID=A0A844BBN5_9BURK|nr:hypothetical protein [Caenimonas koreensis]MRD49019.1 hypothetical protein [Caenimonas koreensis DSM 17982]